MQFPQFKGKSELETLTSPGAYLEYLKTRGAYPSNPAPSGIVMCYSRRLFDYIRENHKTTPGDGFAKFVHFLDESYGKIAVTKCFGIGAPTAVTVVEELIAWGVKSFISIGTAGTLQPSISIGDIVLCERAIRDEGTSFHYIAPAKYAEASKILTDKLEIQLQMQNLRFFRGTSWTTDAPYRETIEEARAYQAEGITTVDMEAAALFSVGAFRNVEMSAMFSVSDSLAKLKWEPHFHNDKTMQSLEKIFQAAKCALSS